MQAHVLFIEVQVFTQLKRLVYSSECIEQDQGAEDEKNYFYSQKHFQGKRVIFGTSSVRALAAKEVNVFDDAPRHRKYYIYDVHYPVDSFSEATWLSRVLILVDVYDTRH